MGIKNFDLAHTIARLQMKNALLEAVCKKAISYLEGVEQLGWHEQELLEQLENALGDKGEEK